MYNDTGFLLVMAPADGALFGINSLDDLRKKQIPRGEKALHLRYNETHLEKPIILTLPLYPERADLEYEA
jgi:hypothetical protein